MADIELVIKIPEDIRVAITRMGLSRIPDEMQKEVDRAIQCGTPLPSEHGDLVDISPYKGKVICSRLYSGVKNLIEVDSIEPIIETNKEDK